LFVVFISAFGLTWLGLWQLYNQLIIPVYPDGRERRFEYVQVTFGLFACQGVPHGGWRISRSDFVAFQAPQSRVYAWYQTTLATTPTPNEAGQQVFVHEQAWGFAVWQVAFIKEARIGEDRWSNDWHVQTTGTFRVCWASAAP
jgi:hypothetical protein